MSSHTHLEIEQKFAVDIDTPLPALTDAEGIGAEVSRESQDLSAVYFDTADLRLLRAKITLRRRTGGNDAGWHIKMPASLGRREIHAGLEDSCDEHTVPPALLSNILYLVRSAELSPIARVDNQRTEITYANDSGEPVVELCDDHVSATSLLPAGRETRWREWEIELKETPEAQAAGEDILASAAQILHKAGALPSPSASKLATALGESAQYAPLPPFLQHSTVSPGTPVAAVVEALQENRDKLLEYDPKVRANEWDSVHQMRVATRELRSHLQTFHGIVSGEQVAHIEHELKALAGVLGEARDAEVVEMRWKSLVEADETGLLEGEIREHILHDMGREYRRAHRRVVAALNSQRYLTLLDELDAFLLDPPLASAEEEPAHAPAEPAELAEPAVLNETTLEQEKAARKAAKKALKQAQKRSLKKARADMNAVMAQHLYEAYRKLVKRHKKAVKNWDNEELSLHERESYFHDIRKAAKKLRYAAEAAGKTTDLDTREVYKACKDIQSVLGDFQDTVTSRDKLVELASRATRRGEYTFGYGMLFERERHTGLVSLAEYHATYPGIKKAFTPLKKHL